MRNVRTGILVAAAGLVLGPACRLFHPPFHGKVPVVARPAAGPKELPPAGAARRPRAQPIPPPPVIAPPPTPARPPAAIRSRLGPLPPPRQPVRKRRRKRRKPLPATRPAQASPVARAPARPAPRLTEYLTAEQIRRYNREIDARLVRVRAVLDRLGKRQLNEEQMLMLDRVRSFVKQTEQARTTDIVTARGLARRADLLARDLEGSVR